MSNNKPTPRAHAHHHEHKERPVEQLVEEIEAIHNPSAHQMLQECLESVLNFYRPGHSNQAAHYAKR